ncbi:helix-turn-helix domain-containing protein [Dyella monticola]|uniref:helix-turn-helix domain-containing protein n=1 Tax=Dyella monticola TaxID=1927958 RepID=UPI0018AD4B23|nr:hypothetical protein [Dyella monticola]
MDKNLFNELMQSVTEMNEIHHWEQGRRNPTGPARALLRAIERDPKHVLAALIG